MDDKAPPRPIELMAQIYAAVTVAARDAPSVGSRLHYLRMAEKMRAILARYPSPTESPQ